MNLKEKFRDKHLREELYQFLQGWVDLLSPLETAILFRLALERGDIVDYDTLRRDVGGRDYSRNALETGVGRLRDKLKLETPDYFGKPVLEINSIRGKGYRLQSRDSDHSSDYYVFNGLGLKFFFS